ncbi:hypothetical protein ABL78_0057 [Leptomonas seymouri]|uniref:Uncharacterized protein n=1 Tax=Leptomonas seymouri TaxID=5684 RepID=A0A0N1IMP1_LEPSE|nr:hypothetical protein ABL78_0057 [Leptomonas seymouri]|eukprot:KPI90824.1 hypothetical protein ABL78_0057 [Leptomonas seymouri]
MDISKRRCFLNVYTYVDEEPRLLQLEPNVKFHNVLGRFDEAGDLYWQEQLIDPEATPASLGMPCGVDQANTLWFMPIASSYEWPSAIRDVSQRLPLVETTTAMRSLSSAAMRREEERSPRQGRAASLPAYFDATVNTPPRESRILATGNKSGGAVPATNPVPVVSWYSRPRLLSPAQPAEVTVSAVPQASRQGTASQEAQRRLPSPPIKATPYAPSGKSSCASKLPLDVPAAASATQYPVSLQHQQQQPPRSPPLDGVGTLLPTSHPRLLFAPKDDVRLGSLPVARPHVAETRRNKPILIDPAVLVDDLGPVELLQSELRRLQRDVQGLKSLQVEQRRTVNSNPHLYRGSAGAPRQKEVLHPSTGVVATSPSPIPASATADASVEELAMELHSKQMQQLYEQRRFYLTHSQVVS